MRPSITFPQVAKIHSIFDQRGALPLKLFKSNCSRTGSWPVPADAIRARTLSASRAEIRKALGLWPLFVREVVVDYSMTLGQMIATGNFDYVEKEFTRRNFPIEKENRNGRSSSSSNFLRNVGRDSPAKVTLLIAVKSWTALVIAR